MRDREGFVAGEPAVFVEQGAFGGDERQGGHRGIGAGGRFPCRGTRPCASGLTTVSLRLGTWRSVAGRRGNEVRSGRIPTSWSSEPVSPDRGGAAARAPPARGGVLEARDRVGGRVLNRLGNGKVVELGGESIGPATTPVDKLVADSGSRPSPTTTPRPARSDGRVKRYGGEIPPLPEAALVDLGQSQVRFDRLGEARPVGAPGSPRRRAWDEETFALGAPQQVHGEREVLLGGVLRSGVRGRAPGLLVAVRAHVHARRRRHEQPDRRANAAQQDRVVGGSQLVASAGRASATGCARRAGAPDHADGRRVRSRPTGTKYGRARVVAIPPVLAGRISYEPLLPARPGC